jgi:hypothetical protein
MSDKIIKSIPKENYNKFAKSHHIYSHVMAIVNVYERDYICIKSVYFGNDLYILDTQMNLLITYKYTNSTLTHIYHGSDENSKYYMNNRTKSTILHAKKSNIDTHSDYDIFMKYYINKKNIIREFKFDDFHDIEIVTCAISKIKIPKDVYQIVKKSKLTAKDVEKKLYTHDINQIIHSRPLGEIMSFFNDNDVRESDICIKFIQCGPIMVIERRVSNSMSDETYSYLYSEDLKIIGGCSGVHLNFDAPEYKCLNEDDKNYIKHYTAFGPELRPVEDTYMFM